MIKAEKITKHYKINNKKKIVFENLSFELPQGARLALLGPNGAGKSTLLRVLSGIEAPNKGRVVRTSSISWPIALGRGFIPNLTARENVKFVCRLFNSSKQQIIERIEFVYDFTELGAYFDMPIATFSSGMRSRLAFGLSMAFEFDCYVIDEVLSTGDATLREKSKQVLNNRLMDKGIIMVSHNLTELKKFCNHGIYLTGGKLYFEDLDKIIERYNKDCELQTAED
jgi:capsular polysaccharide transport system ATP-binding protein